MSALLETTNLGKTFGAVVAASDINARIDVGETVGVIGANGAGKTTFINMITGYLTPSEGAIKFWGDDITGLAPRLVSRRGIRRSFQIPQLFPELSVLENMLLSVVVAEEGQPKLRNRAITKAREQRCRSVLETFGIEGFAGQAAGTIPQGIKKLLDIGMATVGETELVLLDEPTSGVSRDEKMTIMERLIGALRSSKTTIMFIEHDMEIVSKFAERVLAFYEGQVLADGPTAEVLSAPDVLKYVVGDQAHKLGAGT